MNHDFPLSTHSQSNGDFWTQGPAALVPHAHAPAAAGKTTGAQTAKPSPMLKIHRLLRGRYPLAIALAAVCAGTGALAGFMALPPKFESVGKVAVNPIVPNPGPGEPIVPMLTMFIQTQVGLISGADVADRALKDPLFTDAWDKAYPNAALPAVADFQAAVDAQHEKNGSLIRVAFTDKNKGVSEAGCKAVLKAYMELHGAADQFSLVQQRIDFNNARLDASRKTLTYAMGEMNQLRDQYGSTDLVDRNNKMQDLLVDLDKQVDTAKAQYDDAVSTLAGNSDSAQPMDKEDIYAEIAAVDIPMRNLLANRDSDQSLLDKDISLRVGSRNPIYAHQLDLIAKDQQMIEEYAHRYLTSRRNQIGPAITDKITPDYVARLKQQYLDAKKSQEEQRAKAKDLGFQIDQINRVREEIKEQNDQIATCNANINALEAQVSLYKPVLLADAGGEAQVPTDKRKLAAGVGFVFGGLLPLGLMLLYGLSENKFRFSDDANEHDMLGTTLLGILPNLPDRLSDPQQAGVAAHCVHQIRTMLQISRSNDEPQVLAITSASSGDGKTSLCLALGLSYAACGARTLLIDCDLVAAGLTHRLNVTSTDGVLEAVANRALLEYVRTTDIADVAILPVGTTHAHHASTLSPVALRRLISEGKKHFDIIIIDTGPLLGSIEASLVCAAADRSILAVARNQQRPLVERSIRHLQEIGAHLAGVVFNRAHASDFERSMSGLALRSRPAGAVPSPAQSGTVAGSFKKKAG